MCAWMIDAFQSKPGFNVIVLSTTAIGFGVNIQAANHVIHFTRPWNPAKEDQATDRAHLTPSTGDGGVDIVAFKDGSGFLIQCKTTSTGKALGWAGVKDVIAGATAYKLKHPGVAFRLAAITNTTFNEAARQQAELNAVELFQADTLIQLLEQYPVNLAELL